MATFSFAQNPIPNAGFENWMGGNPSDWFTSNVQGFMEPITKSENRHSESYAVKGEVLSTAYGIVPPSLWSDAGYFEISQNYTRLTGYYQFSTMGEDAVWVFVEFFDAQYMYVAGGTSELGETSGEYTQFGVNLNYTFGSGQPATQAYLYILIGLSSDSQIDSLTAGSYFLIDDLEFDNVSSLSDEIVGDSPKTYRLAQNYPNPFFF